MEKEVSFQIDRKEEYLEVSSNIEDNYDMLEIDEIMAIITELLNCATEKIKSNVIATQIEDNVIEEIDEEKMLEIKKEIYEETGDFTGHLIYGILNFIHNKELMVAGQELKEVSYSLAVYTDSENNNLKEVYETFHYCKVKSSEKILGCVAFFKDIVTELLNNSNSKDEVKQKFNKSMQIILYNIYNYIDKYEHVKE